MYWRSACIAACRTYTIALRFSSASGSISALIVALLGCDAGRQHQNMRQPDHDLLPLDARQTAKLHRLERHVELARLQRRQRSLARLLRLVRPRAPQLLRQESRQGSFAEIRVPGV